MSVVCRRVEGFTHEISADGHTLIADEPAEAGGNDRGLRPTRLLAASLASCTSITMAMYAERKGWQLSSLEVEVDYELVKEASSFTVVLRLPKELSEEQVERLRVIAGKCPVHRAIAGEVVIDERVELA